VFNKSLLKAISTFPSTVSNKTIILFYLLSLKLKPSKSILDRSYKIKYGEWAIADECLVIVNKKIK